MTSKTLLCLPALLLASCSVGPNFALPDLALPAKWKNGKTASVSDLPMPGEWWLSLEPSKRHHSRPAVMRVCITAERDIIMREGGTLCYVGWTQSVLEGAQWKRAELVPADPFAGRAASGDD